MKLQLTANGAAEASSRGRSYLTARVAVRYKVDLKTRVPIYDKNGRRETESYNLTDMGRLLLRTILTKEGNENSSGSSDE